MPPVPTRFSTTKVPLNASPKWVASSRAIRSALLPALNGTMILTVCLPGHSSALPWAEASWLNAQASSASATIRQRCRARPVRAPKAPPTPSIVPASRIDCSQASVSNLTATAPIGHECMHHWRQLTRRNAACRGAAACDYGEFGDDVLEAVLLDGQRIVAQAGEVG